MRIFLVGQKWLGAETLKLCLQRGHEVVGVCAPEFSETPDSKVDRLWLAAAEARIPVEADHELAPERVPAGTDLIVCAHAHVFVSRDVRARARLGAIGYHPSLLPRHRGRDAVRWAIHMREAITGGTVYWMTDTADGGPIAAQQSCHIRPDDTPETLWRRELGPMGLQLFERVLDDVSRGIYVRIEQDDRLATWEPAFKRPRFSQERMAPRTKVMPALPAGFRPRWLRPAGAT